MNNRFRWAQRLAFWGLTATSALACGTSKSQPAADTGASGDDPVVGGARPADLRVPSGYDPTKPAPLLVMLHGYSTSGLIIGIYLKMASIADAHGFFYVAPDGTVDSKGSHYWNATDACCSSFGTDVDDVGYITALIKEIQGRYKIDPKRIYVMGHSNGGYMAHRLACDRSDLIAGAVSVAGAVWSDPTKCNPSAPVAVLQIHGTEDKSVLYAGTIPSGGDAGPLGDSGSVVAGYYPGAEQTIATWGKKNSCADALVGGASIHADADGKGNETSVSRHEGCAKNGAAELWKVQGAGHVFVLTPDGLEGVWKFLESHAKAS